MNGRRNTRCDAKPLEPAASEWAKVRLEAELCSDALLARLANFGQAPQSVEPRPTLSFPEQLAAVASGRARIVETSPLRTAANQRIDGGMLL